MTFRDVMRAAMRRWYVMIAVVIAAAIITVLFARDGGTYTTKTVVTFTLPASTTISPESGTDNESVIAFAGTVASEINRGRPTPRYSTGDAPFYGAGVRQGILVGLRDDGSQWAPSFGSAVIEIQIVGRTYEWVAEQQTVILGAIEEIVAAQQDSAAAASDQRINALVEPLTTRIDYVSSSRTEQIAAIGAMAVAAVLAGGWAAVVIDRVVRRRQSARLHRAQYAGGIAT